MEARGKMVIDVRDDHLLRLAIERFGMHGPISPSEFDKFLSEYEQTCGGEASSEHGVQGEQERLEGDG
jgi:hypothetical protein